MLSSLVAAPLALASLSASAPEHALPYRKFVLDNGLEVVIHEDHSDPVVAVCVDYHVGSAREEPGRSGLAQLLERLLLRGTQHVGDGLHRELVEAAGGTLEVSSDRDRTTVLQTLPSNQLELALWLESDRMGFLLPAVTQEAVAALRDARNDDERPSDRERDRIARSLYPAGHPYGRPAAGCSDERGAATLDDVHAFFRRWYGPGNATLAIGGDVRTEEALALVETYFASLPRGAEVEPPEARPAALAADARVVLQDRVELPRLTLAWHTVPAGHADEPALALLDDLLAANRAAILDRALTIDAELAGAVAARQSSGELAGAFTLGLRARPGVSLDVLEEQLRSLLRATSEAGIDPAHLQRVQTAHEAAFVRGLETVAARTSRLARDNTLHGDPGLAAAELRRHLDVTTGDVERVLARYLVDRPAVVLSTVPAGAVELAASGRGADERAAEAALDRARQPAAGARPTFRTPEVWRSRLENGVAVIGAPYDELPLTRIRLGVPAGRLYESTGEPGLSSMTAALLAEGTEALSTTELAAAWDATGARFSVRSDDHEIAFELSVLDEHAPRALALLEQVLRSPRFDERDFERVRAERLVAIDARADDASGTAERAFARLVFGDTARGLPALGTRASVEAMTVEDVRGFWRRNGVPDGARLSVVGDWSAEAAGELLAPLAAAWVGDRVEPSPASFAVEAEVLAAAEPGLYLVDRPGAARSELRIGHLCVASTDSDYYPLLVLNHVLGGSSSSRVSAHARGDERYAGGARTRLSGGRERSPFVASSAVRADVTGEAVIELMKELDRILAGVGEEELARARDTLAQALCRRFESTAGRLDFVEALGAYGFPDDYLSRRLELLEQLGTDDLRELALKYVHPDRAVILVVGDGAVVAPRLAELGYGPVRALDVDGVPLAAR